MNNNISYNYEFWKNLSTFLQVKQFDFHNFVINDKLVWAMMTSCLSKDKSTWWKRECYVSEVPLFPMCMREGIF